MANAQAVPDKSCTSAGSSSLAGLEVAAFYSSWLNYSTLKDFAWADKYNPAAAPNRKVCTTSQFPPPLSYLLLTPLPLDHGVQCMPPRRLFCAGLVK